MNYSVTFGNKLPKLIIVVNVLSHEQLEISFSKMEASNYSNVILVGVE